MLALVDVAMYVAMGGIITHKVYESYSVMRLKAELEQKTAEYEEAVASFAEEMDAEPEVTVGFDLRPTAKQ